MIYKRDATGGLALESAAFGGGRIMVSEGSNGNIYTPHYFITDHLGSTRAVVNAVGTVIERNDYYPFGGKHENPQLAVSDNRFRFSGKEDQTIGSLPYQDFGARFLGNGRWTSIDPLSEIDYPTSPYAYVGNNPVKYIDPKGKEKIIAYNKNEIRNNTLIPAAIKYRDDLSIHIFAHGNSKEIRVFMDQGNAVERIRIDSPEQFEDFLNEYSQTWQSRSPDKRVIVVLHSCETGQERNGKSSIARKISNKLKNVTIIAPDEKLAVGGKPAKIDPTKTVKTDPLKTDETDPLKTGEVDPLKTE